jgi:hypothetical protein
MIRFTPLMIWNSCFPLKLSFNFKNNKIGVYEMLAILVGFRTWGNYYKEKRILIQCDNSSCVSLLNTGRCRNNQMLSIARNSWMTCAKNNILSYRSSHKTVNKFSIDILGFVMSLVGKLLSGRSPFLSLILSMHILKL